MSPADELRAAANKLREYKGRATPGPWSASAVWSPRSPSTSAVYSYAHPTGTPESEVIPSMRATKKRPLVRPGDAEWIALMSPAVAEPLATSLDNAADYLAKHYADSQGPHARAATCTDPECRLVAGVLDLARAITGSAS